MAELSPEEKQAAFSYRFKGTTNLAQRRRYQEQIDNYEMQRRTDAANRYERALGAAEMADPLKAESNRTSRIRESRLANEFITREDRMLREEEEKKRQFELRMQNDEKALELRQKQETRAEEKRAAELEIASLESKQSHRVFMEMVDMAKRGIRPGSPKFADAAFRLLRDNPNLPKDVRQGLHRDSHIDVSLEQLDADAELLKDKNARITRSPNGVSYTISTPKPTKETSPEDERLKLERRHKFLTDEFNATKDPNSKESLNPELTKYFEGQINEVRKKLYNFGVSNDGSGPSGVTAPSKIQAGAGAYALTPTPSQAPLAASQPATEPTSAESPVPAFKGVFKDGKIFPAE